MASDSANDNDVGHDGTGKPPVPPAEPSLPPTRKVAPDSVEAQRRAVREAAEERILREGEAARLALARRTAREALTDAGVLDAKRLARLGSDGIAHFITELRDGALGTAKPATPPVPASAPSTPPSRTATADEGPISPSAPKPTSSQVPARQQSTQGVRTDQVGAPVRRQPAVPPTARRQAPARPIVAPTIRAAAFVGWWQSQAEGRPSFEARARRWGVLAGTLLTVACLVFLAMTQR